DRTETPITADTRFLIASLSKAYCAALVMKLKEQGKLALDDKLSDFIDEYSKARQISIFNLLTHTSGVPDAYGAIEDRIDKEPIEVSDMLDVIKNKRLRFKPGSRFEYSNMGYVLLGEVVRRASGEKYADLMSRHVFEALGLKHTSVGAPKD